MCDGEDLAGLSCADFGLVDGTLACNMDCTFDLSSCLGCGNGVIEDNEVCDGADLGDATCMSLGHAGGELSCDNACTAFVEDDCVDP
jgi:hypothetical protein